MDFADALDIPSLRSDFMDLGACFLNCHRMTAAKGGRSVLGWMRAGVLVMGPSGRTAIEVWTHHCVWASPEGKLFDLTPQVNQDGFVSLGQTRFQLDEQATLLTRGPLWISRPPYYEPVVEVPSVRQAVEALYSADRKLLVGDLRGEAYWVGRAAKLLRVVMDPQGEAGLRQMQPFALP